jgi:hypothetical protein
MEARKPRPFHRGKSPSRRWILNLERGDSAVFGDQLKLQTFTVPDREQVETTSSRVLFLWLQLTPAHA